MDDRGVRALVVLPRFHQVALDPGRIRHKFGDPGTPFSPEDILRAAFASGFRAKRVESSVERLNDAVLPAIGMDTQGGFFIIARTARDE